KEVFDYLFSVQNIDKSLPAGLCSSLINGSYDASAQQPIPDGLGGYYLLPKNGLSVNHGTDQDVRCSISVVVADGSDDKASDNIVITIKEANPSIRRLLGAYPKLPRA